MNPTTYSYFAGESRDALVSTRERQVELTPTQLVLAIMATTHLRHFHARQVVAYGEATHWSYSRETHKWTIL
jgi:hypothetical protein